MTRTKRNTKARTFQNFKNAAIVKVEALRDTAMERAGVARAKGAAVLTQLERAFQQRVSKAAARLGVPTAREVRALARQVAELEARIAKLRRARA
jgi:poly(hydroxyalkanoate) granule-associated protein